MGPDGGAAAAKEAEDEAEKVCRYCLDDENTEGLISPCKCSGGQKWVHKHCLIQWQRTTLVSQPTHPAFHDRDRRHQTCNVCKAEFTCEPPTRQELMASFTGPEIAALVEARCVIASHERFSTMLEAQLELANIGGASRGPLLTYKHWIRGVFLITSVEEDSGVEVLPVQSQAVLAQVREMLGPGLVLHQQGRRFRMDASHSLAGVAPEAMAEAFARLEAPCEICFVPDEPNDCGHDIVSAVNLARQIDEPPRPEKVRQAVEAACGKYRGAAAVKLEHYIGGPCAEGTLVTCLVLGGGGCGWTVLKDLRQAVELAHQRAVRRFEAQGDICGGQAVRLTGLRAAAHLNGEIGLALRFADSSGRWLVRLRDGDGKQLKPENLEGLEGAGGRVMCFWGDARWTRAQLLGEIAKGDWGLCRGGIGDLAAVAGDRWRGTEGRLAFAPVTEMTEGYMRAARAEMQARHARAQMHADPDAEQEEDGSPVTRSI